MANVHLHDELRQSNDRVTIPTRHGPVTGGRASNGAAVFLEVPYALPPKRFTDPEPLPADYRYEDREFISEQSYATQPLNDGQSQGGLLEDNLGLGQPTENPLFVNIVTPPSFPSRKGFPVKVYIHGGYLQFGSPHTLNAQAQYVAAERSEVWVNIAYRLSAFGFLASDVPRLTGNYGFKDQWLALEWIKSIIEAFGGDPENIQIMGLSAGAHSVHQHLHHVSCLADGEIAPFQSAVLQSNAILEDPRTPGKLRHQFRALCKALQLDPDSADILDILRDPTKVSASSITDVIVNDTLEARYQIFRGCLSSDWIITSPGPMERQRTGEFSRQLLKRGVRSIAVGEVSEEWFIYSLTHPIPSPRDIAPTLGRIFSDSMVRNLLQCFRTIPDDATTEEATKLFGEILCAAQVHIPIRILHKDLCAAGFPVIRYRIEWTPEQVRPNGYVSHGTDKPVWALRIPALTSDQVPVVRDWLKTFYDAVDDLKSEQGGQNNSIVLKLTKDRIEWAVDETFDSLTRKFEML